MAAEIRFIDGDILFVDGQIAMSEDCCCDDGGFDPGEGSPCTNCTDNMPEFVAIGGFQMETGGASCLSCDDDINGQTFILTQNAASPCNWEATFPFSSCTLNDTFTVLVDVSVSGTTITITARIYLVSPGGPLVTYNKVISTTGATTCRGEHTLTRVQTGFSDCRGVDIGFFDPEPTLTFTF